MLKSHTRFETHRWGFIVFAGLLTAHALPAFSGHEVGDGGDPVIILFDLARQSAANIIAEVDTHTDLISSDVASLIQNKRDLIHRDILTAPHRWLTDDETQSTCARTNLPGGEPTLISLSLSKCRDVLLQPGRGEIGAILTLIHESAHHFGVDGSEAGERFGVKVAEEIYSAWRSQREHRQPFWAELPPPSFPFNPRVDHAWTKAAEGSMAQGRGAMFIFQGCDQQVLPGHEECTNLLSDSSVYSYSLLEPRQGEWSLLSSIGAPTARRFHSANWAEVHDGPLNISGPIVFGGCAGIDVACRAIQNDAKIYDTANNVWTSLPDSLMPRFRHSSVWSDNAMIVFGGLVKDPSRPGQVTAINSGEILRAAASPTGGVNWTWSELKPKLPNEFAARFDHKSIWTGKSLIVWGGCASLRIGRCADPLMDGLVYTPDYSDPTKDQWTYIAAPSALVPREGASVVWTGRQLLVWGGRSGSTILDDGAALDLESPGLTWKSLPNLLPTGETGRFASDATWDGTRQRALFWGGRHSTDFGAESYAAGMLSLDLDKEGLFHWHDVPMENSPAPSIKGTFIGNFDQAITWGGLASYGRYAARGFVFFP
jgi:hypothetical protein